MTLDLTIKVYRIIDSLGDRDISRLHSLISSLDAQVISDGSQPLGTMDRGEEESGKRTSLKLFQLALSSMGRMQLFIASMVEPLHLRNLA